jgi:LacI family transcriptional regulator
MVGFDDVPEAVHLRPPLTTVRQPLADMGRMATRMLLQRISDSDAALSSAITKTEFIIRESAAPLVGRPERRSASRTVQDKVSR